jgi:uncharacterized membrane protein
VAGIYKSLAGNITMRKANWAMLVMIAASFIIGAWLYPGMPESLPSHWNIRGEVDGYMPKFWALFLMPIITVGLTALFLVIPRIDPKKSNIEKFRKYYEALVVLIVAFLFYIYLLTLFWNLGYVFDMGQMLVPALGFLFYFIGSILDKVKTNWFIGIRTPWTLSSERVWKLTHRKGGMVFRASGVIALFGILFPVFAVWLLLAPILVGVAYLMVYSYMEYQKEAGKAKGGK